MIMILIMINRNDNTNNNDNDNDNKNSNDNDDNIIKYETWHFMKEHRIIVHTHTLTHKKTGCSHVSFPTETRFDCYISQDFG